MSFFSRLPIACAILLSVSLHGVDLVNGLGSPPGSSTLPGFGENVLPANDDGSTAAIDITSIFPGGLLFGGDRHTTLYVNNNGCITFERADSTFTPSQIQAGASTPRIAAYFADVDTTGGSTFRNNPGTSKGTNLVYWDLDVEHGVFTVTWDDVGYFPARTNLANAFQIRLIRVDNAGSFDIEFRYEQVEWTTGNASGGTGGLGGTVARAGYTAANGTDFYELPQSGIQNEMLALETLSNQSPVVPGLFRFNIRRPTATITPAEGSYTNASPIRFAIEWAFPIRDFTQADLSAVGGTLVGGSLTTVVAGSSYTVDVTPTADGPVTLTIAENAAFAEGNGNGNIATPRTVNSDRTPPVLTITPNGSTVFTERVFFNATPTEPLIGFFRDDVVSTNGSLVSFQIGYNFSVQTSSDGPLTVTVPRTSMTDRAGNQMAADATATVTVKTVGPVTTVSAAPAGPVNGDPLTFTITFASAVTGFTASDLAITNGTITTALAGGPTVWTVGITPTADGLVRLTVPTGAAADSDGLGNLTASISVVNDLIAPTVSISMPTGPIAGPVLAYLDFSEPVSGVTVSAGGGVGTVGAVTAQTGSLTRFAVTVTPTGTGTLTLNVTGANDLAGNAFVGPVSATVTTDTALEALAITTTAANRTTVSPIPVTFTFTGGAVTGFTADDVSVSNGTRGALAGTGPFTMNVTPAGDGPVTISVASSACLVGAANNGAGRLVVISDRSGPVPSVRIDPVNGVPGQTAVATLTFPEPVTGLAIGDLTVAGGAVTSVTADATNTVFTVRINCSARPSASTVVTLTAGTCQDAAGNLNPATTFTVYSIESTAGSSGLDRSGSCATGAGLAMIFIGLLGIGLRQRRRRA